MKKQSAIVCMIMIIFNFLMFHNVRAQDIPVLKDVVVKAIVEFEENMGLYKYSYAITNPSTNSGKVRNIQIDISKIPATQELGTEGLIVQGGLNSSGTMLTRSFEEAVGRMASLMKKEVVPVGVQVPAGWRGSIYQIGTASWGAVETRALIMPGQSSDGFVLSSRGIPSIRDVSVKPKWVLVIDHYVTKEDMEKSKRIEEQITFKGKTIGPTAPPKDLNPVDFLDNLISMKHEAFAQGWITNKGIEQSLDAKLDAARRKLLSGSFIPARNTLLAFINEVEAQGCETHAGCNKGKHIKPEAYALLKYNALYLIDNLK